MSALYNIDQPKGYQMTSPSYTSVWGQNTSGLSSPVYPGSACLPQGYPTEYRVAIESGPSQRPWQFLADVSSYLLLVGYLVLPLSFNDSKYNEHIDRTGTAVAAAVFIGAGYALSIMLLAAQFRDRDYMIYSLILPQIPTNLLGVLNALLNIFIRDLLPLHSREVAAIALPSAVAFFCTLAALSIHALTSIKITRRSTPDRETVLLTEEELQRQQLLRLLQDKSGKRASKGVHSTFKVKLSGA
ncbi:hypothetical protein BDW42DRAFT_65891 [Aspergillus taichungensis]|uniref:Uncharacterized protein n=1 Tax=Aspergillus taichungensis TaxID=482145 RepID=A0A2J5I0X2_9EURO|nr:hypothetical protein BDW42DRAFT_65891 [Aspergillus taichungensis]